MSHDDAIPFFFRPGLFSRLAGRGAAPRPQFTVSAASPPDARFEVLADVTADHQEPEQAAGWSRLRITRCPDGRVRCERITGPSPLEVRRELADDLEAARRFFGDSAVSRELFQRIAAGPRKADRGRKPDVED